MQGSIVLQDRQELINDSVRYQELSDAFERLGYHFTKRDNYIKPKIIAQKNNRNAVQSSKHF